MPSLSFGPRGYGQWLDTCVSLEDATFIARVKFAGAGLGNKATELGW